MTLIPQEGASLASFFLIVGPSGVGKNTLINRVVQRDATLAFAPSITTRPMRLGEIDGNPYYFVSRKQFEDLLHKDEVLEFNQVHGNYYGTSRRIIEDLLKKGIDVITDIEVVGAHRILINLPFVTCTVFILPPSRRELRRRILQRHPEEEEQLQLRLARTEIEMAMIDSFEYSIRNENINDAEILLSSIINAQRAKRQLLNELLNQGKTPIYRTISFNIRKPKGFINEFQEIDLTLPKTVLGPVESYCAALWRVVHLINLSSGTELKAEDFVFRRRREKQHLHANPIPCQELETCYTLDYSPKKT